MLTPDKLQAIKERTEKATRGPWIVSIGRSNHAVFGPGPVRGQKFIVCDVANEADNALFIAHAREDIPALVRQVEALQNEIVFVNKLLEAQTKRLEEKCTLAAGRNDFYSGIITCLAVLALHDQRVIYDEIIEALDLEQLIAVAKLEGELEFSGLAKYGYIK